MTTTQRNKKLKAIIKHMGGRLNGHNIDNYKRIAVVTMSSVQTVKAWVGGYRNIPELKLELLTRSI